MVSRLTSQTHITSQNMATIPEDNYTRSAPVLRVAESSTPSLMWPEIPFVVAVTACGLVVLVCVLTTTILLLSIRRMRRVQPDKTEADKTTLPNPASAVSIADTDVEYEGIYSRIDDILPCSRLARDNNTFPRFTTEARQGQGCQYVAGAKVESVMMLDVEPVYATVDEVIKTIPQEIPVQYDDGITVASPYALSRDISQNGRVQDCINGTKDTLSKSLLYTKIDITKTIRYRLKMAQILSSSNRNKNTSHKDDDVTNINYVDNVLYESVTSQKGKKGGQNKICGQPSNMEEMDDCRDVRCKNEREEVDRVTAHISTNMTADGNNNMNGKHKKPDASPYETIPADFDHNNETDYSPKKGETTHDISDGTAENNIRVNITETEDRSEENVYMCMNEHHYSMSATDGTDIYEKRTDAQTRETSL